MPNKNTNNYNKDYFTTRGIPQPGAETDTEQEKQKLAKSERAQQPDPDEQETEATGPDQDAEIARAMGRKPDGGK